MSKKSKQNPFTSSLLRAIVDHFSDKCFDVSIYGFTEVIKEGNLYRTDNDYRNSQVWKDNVMISWQTGAIRSNNIYDDKDDENSRLVPAELQMFFQIENNSVLYCVIHSCHYKNEKSSVLSRIWMKEYDGVAVSNFSNYKSDYLTISSDTNPLFRVVECDSIHSHTLLMPFKHQSWFVLQIIHPTKWANEFLYIP